MATVTFKWSGNPPCGAASPPYIGEKYNLFLDQSKFSEVVVASIEGTFVSEGAGGAGYDRTYTFSFDDEDTPSSVTKLCADHFKDIGCMNGCCEELTARVNIVEGQIEEHLSSGVAFEGNWDVILSDAAGGGNESPTTVVGDYLKVGDMVFASFLALNNIDTTGMVAGNELFISLPFTPASRVIGSVALDNFLFPVGMTMVSPVTTGLPWSRLIFTGSGVPASFATVASILTGASDIYAFSLYYKAI